MSEIIKIQQVPEEVKNIRPFLEWERMEISCQDDVELCSSRLIQIKDHKKKTKSIKDLITKPLMEAKRNTDEIFKSILGPLDTVEIVLKRKLTTYMDKVQKEKDEQLRKELEERKKKAEEESRKSMALAMETKSNAAFEASQNWKRNAEKIDTTNVFNRQTIRLQQGTVAQKKVWKWKITDEQKVPREFLIIDEKRINMIARGYAKDAIEIDGIEFFQETSVSVGR